MLANLKIRTGVMGVLLAFLVALMLSSFSAWYSVESTQEKLERVNGIYATEVVPLLHASNDMLSARVLIGSTFMNFQAGEGADLTGDATRTRALLATAQRHHGVFAAYPYEEDAKEGAAAVTRSFNAYHATLGRMVDAIEARSVRDYESANRQAQAQNAAFEAAVASLASHMDDASDALVEDARSDFLMTRIAMFAIAGLSVLLAIGCWFFMQRTVLRPLDQASVHFDRIAAGDMTGHVEVRSTNEIGMLFAALRRMQGSLTRTVARVRSGVDEINVGAREIAAGNNDLSGRTEQQAASLEQTAASMEELASTVKQNADNARQANALAAGASSVAQRGGQAVGAVVQTMEGISTSSHKIAEIVGVIDSIAFQTNILALNAAVEAARAGEQGKGFAVVAAEVRSLAQRSAQAAKEIKTLIDDSVDKVNNGSAQVESAGATMQEIVEAVRRVSDIIAEIAAASNEQAGGIDQVNQAVTSMDQVTQQNAALVEQAAAAAGALQDQAQSLAQAVQVFRIDAGSLQDGGSEQTATIPLATVGTDDPASPVSRALPRETGTVVPLARKTQRGDERSEVPGEPRHVVQPGGELAARRLRKEVVPALPARRVATPPKETAVPNPPTPDAGPTSAAGGRAGRSSASLPAGRPAGSVEPTAQRTPRAAAPDQPAARRKPQVKDDDWETF